MEVINQILGYIPTDQSLGAFVQAIKADYIIAAIVAWKLLGKPLIMLFKYVASMTPWKSDDELWGDIDSQIDQALNKKLGLPGSTPQPR